MSNFLRFDQIGGALSSHSIAQALRKHRENTVQTLQKRRKSKRRRSLQSLAK